MITEIFGAKSGAKLVELVDQSRTSIAGKSGKLRQQNQSARQVGMRKVSATRKLSVMPNYILDLSDYAGISNVLISACIA